MQFNLNLVRVLLLTALAAAQRANAALGCDRSYLRDKTKCRVDDINRVFGGSMDLCYSGYPRAYTSTACSATASNINTYEGYGGPVVSCWRYSNEYLILGFKSDADCDVGAKKLRVLLTITSTTSTSTTSITTKTKTTTTSTTTTTTTTTIITTTTITTTSTTTQTSTATTITTASTATTSSSAKTTATDTVAVTTAPATKPDDNVNATGEENNADKYNGSAESIADNSANDTAGGNISAPPTEPQKSPASTRTIVGVLAALILVFAVVGFILWRQNHHATDGGGIPHIVGQNGGVGRDVPPIYHNRMYNIDTSPSEVYPQPNALQPAVHDSQPGRRSTVSATEAGIVYAIPVDLQDDAGSGSTTDNNDYTMPLTNYAVVGTGSSTTANGGGGDNCEYSIPEARSKAASLLPLDLDGYVVDDSAPVGTGSTTTINGGGGGGNPEYSTPEARSKAVPLLSLDLDGYVVDDTAHMGAGAAPGGVVYATSAADSDI